MSQYLLEVKQKKRFTMKVVSHFREQLFVHLTAERGRGRGRMRGKVRGRGRGRMRERGKGEGEVLEVVLVPLS